MPIQQHGIFSADFVKAIDLFHKWRLVHGTEARMLQNKQTMYICDFVCSQNKQT